jgi:hypothetical protein
MKVLGLAYWHRAIDQSRTGQRANEHARVSVLNWIKHWTTVKAKHIALVSGTENVGRIKVTGVDRCSPTSP